MSQCHDPYDAIEGPTVVAIARDSRAPNAAQCHDSYESVGSTTAGLTGRGGEDRHDDKARHGNRRSGPVPRGRIVVGVDGSGASRDALRWAARQAQLTGASLEAVMSWDIAASNILRRTRTGRARTTPPRPRMLSTRPSIASSAILTAWTWCLPSSKGRLHARFSGRPRAPTCWSLEAAATGRSSGCCSAR